MSLNIVTLPPAMDARKLLRLIARLLCRYWPFMRAAFGYRYLMMLRRARGLRSRHLCQLASQYARKRIKSARRGPCSPPPRSSGRQAVPQSVGVSSSIYRSLAPYLARRGCRQAGRLCCRRRAAASTRIGASAARFPSRWMSIRASSSKVDVRQGCQGWRALLMLALALEDRLVRSASLPCQRDCGHLARCVSFSGAFLAAASADYFAHKIAGIYSRWRDARTPTRPSRKPAPQYRAGQPPPPGRR